MTALAGGLVLVLSTLAAILGYYRGRAAALLLASILVLYSIILPSVPTLFLRLGWWGAIGSLAVVLIAFKLFHRRQQQTTAENESDKPESTPSMGDYVWRYVGAASGAVLGLFLCLLLSLGMTWLSRPSPQKQLNAATPGMAADVDQEDDEWAGMRAFGSELASISGGLLERVPVVGKRTRYVRTMQLILLTPEVDLLPIAEAHGLAVIIDRPCVQDALCDKTFAAHLEAFSKGDIRSLGDLVDSPHVEALQADPVVAATVEQFDLEAFTADLRKAQEKAEKEKAVKEKAR